MREKSELDSVVAMLTQWVTDVKLRNSLNDTGINSTSENLVLRLLNAAFDYNLTNLNWDDTNYPAIDLGDRKLGIAVQVTATDTIDKIKETLKKFFTPKVPYKKFPGGLYFFFLKEKPPKLQTKTKQNLKIIATGFDPEQQMWSMNTLLTRMEELYSNDRSRFSKLKAILEEEFVDDHRKLNHRGTKTVRNDRHIFGLGILIGALVEANFVLSHIDENSEKHKENANEFSELAREEAATLGLQDEIESLLDSLAPECDSKSFFH